MERDAKNGRVRLEPTENQTFILRGRGAAGDFVARAARARAAEERGDYGAACEERYAAAAAVVEALPEDEAVDLEWGDANTRAALEVLHDAAVDNFLVGDFELAAAQLELVLDCDGEDHTGATPTLALCYVALREWDCLDDIWGDIDGRSAFAAVVAVLRAHVSGGEADAEQVAALRRFAAVCAELRADEHPASADYLRDIATDRPSQHALARELYLQIAPLLALYPATADYLRRLASE